MDVGSVYSSPVSRFSARDDPVHDWNVFTTTAIASQSNLSVDDRLCPRTTLTQPSADHFIGTVKFDHFVACFTRHSKQIQS